MKRLSILMALITLLTCLASCGSGSWKGFYEEDLSKYIDLGIYDGLTYTKPDLTVTDSEVDERIALLLEAFSELVEIDGKAKDGSTVKFDAYCIIDGESSPDHSFECVSYTVGESYTDLVVNQLLAAISGMKKGESKETVVTIPVDYLQRGDGEKNGTYRITVISVHEKMVPDLNDTLAGKLVMGCKTVAELKIHIKTRIENEKQSRADDVIKNQLKAKLLDASTIKKTPYSVYTSYYNDRISLYKNLAKAASMTFEEYVASKLGMTKNDLEALVSEAALKDTKEALVLYSVVKNEGIECTDELLYDYASKMALRSEGVFRSADEYLSYYGENAVKNDYLWSKVLDTIMQMAIEHVE